MVIVPSPGSIWDYPELNQVSSVMGLVYGTGPKIEQIDLFPPKIRIPETHVNSPPLYTCFHLCGDFRCVHLPTWSFQREL
ncbi:hypothetical protein WH47_03627 [Habropoda laboriosa]|uniref:Uncharacterized protein n=1 Tax=Habropoda laboriosa TaxID=597456 RepID=A0A0L7RIP9_9HYME|nr:hypothetical protein WH47_03627 [Habropoda laboriosa]